MKIIFLVIITLISLFLNGCVELPLTDQRHFDPDLEKRERELMIRKDFATGEERRLIEKDLDRIQNNYLYSPSNDDLFEKGPEQNGASESEKALNERIMKELHGGSTGTLGEKNRENTQHVP